MMRLATQEDSIRSRPLLTGTAASATRRGAAPPHEATAWEAATVNERGTAMGGKMDQIKGLITEAAGVLADDDNLKREGKLDQVVGKVKEDVVRVKGKLAQAVDQIKEALRGDRSRRWAK
jgi:uncharacterized protein YjbJ (UPF0337 family)